MSAISARRSGRAGLASSSGGPLGITARKRRSAAPECRRTGPPRPPGNANAWSRRPMVSGSRLWVQRWGASRAGRFGWAVGESGGVATAATVCRNGRCRDGGNLAGGVGDERVRPRARRVGCAGGRRTPIAAPPGRDDRARLVGHPDGQGAIPEIRPRSLRSLGVHRRERATSPSTGPTWSWPSAPDRPGIPRWPGSGMGPSPSSKPGDVVALDSGVYKIWFARHYPAIEPTSLVLDNATASIGAGPAAATEAARRGNRATRVVGDGGLLMNTGTWRWRCVSRST